MTGIAKKYDCGCCLLDSGYKVFCPEHKDKSTRHSPEPWSITEDEAHFQMYDAAGETLSLETDDVYGPSHWLNHDNLRRAKLCVNACKGVPNPEELEDVLARAKFLLSTNQPSGNGSQAQEDLKTSLVRAGVLR